jgi:hypothetical protein
MPVQLWRYESGPPQTSTLIDALGLRPERYHYVVATAAQQRFRNGQNPTRVQPKDQGRPGDCDLVFHRMLRHWLEARREPLMTRAEERILVQRGARRAVAHVPERDRLHAVRQIWHDATLWAQALAELASRGVDLNATEEGDPDASLRAIEAREILASDELAEVLAGLQVGFKTGEEEAAGPSFEVAARRLLDRGWRPAVPAVVMEGFTFLTPLQRRFIEVCEPYTKLHLVFPYREHQRNAFDIMGRTYKSWWGKDGPIGIGEEVTRERSTLSQMQEVLFSSDVSCGRDIQCAVSRDGALTVDRYRHRDEELRAVVDRIRRYRSNDEWGPKKITIVTPDLEETRLLLQEQAEAEGHELGIPPPTRMLLLTPPGRFVLALYDTWVEPAEAGDGRLALTADRFEEILASG